MNIRVDVYVHDAREESKLDGIIHQLKEMKKMLSQDYLDLCKKIDDASTAVGLRLAALQGQIKNSMTDDEVAAVKTAMQAEVDKLTAMGQDPNAPVPPA